MSASSAPPLFLKLKNYTPSTPPLIKKKKFKNRDLEKVFEVKAVKNQ